MYTHISMLCDIIVIYVYVYIYIYYIYIYIYICDYYMGPGARRSVIWFVGGGDDTIGSPHREQFELFELFLLVKLDNQLSIDRFEPTVVQSTVSSPLLTMIQARIYLDRSIACCIARRHTAKSQAKKLETRSSSQTVS